MSWHPGALTVSQDTGAFVSRNELFAGLAVVGFMNGISERVSSAISESGVTAALLDTFDISAIVWISLAIAIRFLLRGPAQPARPSDWAITACALLAFLVPIVPLSWLALSGLALHLVGSSPRSSALNRGAWVLLAVTVPMFWSRLLFALLSDPILQGDAVLVGWLVGTPRLGNAIQFADGSGYLWIAPGCSSLANVSLTILCWVTLAKVWDCPPAWRNVGWVVAACMAVIAINVTRISLIGLYPGYYEALHGPVGATVANWIIAGVTVGICLLGVRHDRRPARR